MNTLLRILLVLILVSAFTQRASAHDYWTRGMHVPSWVKTSCCAEADAHILDPDDISDVPCPPGTPDPEGKGCHKIKGIDFIVKPDQTFESQDSETWAFYPTDSQGNVFAAAHVYCVFMVHGF